MEASVVEARGVEVRIRRRTIVHSVDLTLSQGVVGLLGPNGAGKTTLVRALATALPVSSGSLILLGYNANSSRDVYKIRRRIGYAAQHPLVLSHLSTSEQVAYAGWLKGLSLSDSSRRAEEVLELVGLADRARSRVGTLSGGMLRRVGIAMALVNNPDLLILDEPTAGLDPEQREQFRSLVSGLGKSCTVVLSTHLLEDVASVCSNVVVMLGGRSVFSGSVDSLAAHGTVAAASSSIHDGYAHITGSRR